MSSCNNLGKSESNKVKSKMVQSKVDLNGYKNEEESSNVIGNKFEVFEKKFNSFIKNMQAENEKRLSEYSKKVAN